MSRNKKAKVDVDLGESSLSSKTSGQSNEEEKIEEFQHDLKSPVEEVNDKEAICKAGLLLWERMASSGYLLPALRVKDMLSGMNGHEGALALIVAKHLGLDHACKFLMDAGANMFATDNKGNTLLHVSILKNNVSRLKLLLQTDGEFVNKINRSGMTPLLLCCKEGNAQCLYLIIKAGGNLNARTRGGDCALHVCARLGHADCLQVLLNNKSAKLEERNRVGYSPLLVAADCDSVECARLLASAGADVNAKSTRCGRLTTALHLCAKRGLVACAAVLISAGAMCDAKDEWGRTPLHRAVEGNQAAVTKLLLDAGASVEERCGDGLTALHVAAMKGNVDCLRLLVATEVDLELEDRKGRTALHVAADQHNRQCLKLLIKCGADTDARTHNGATPLQLSVISAQKYSDNFPPEKCENVSQCLKLLQKVSSDSSCDLDMSCLKYGSLF